MGNVCPPMARLVNLNNSMYGSFWQGVHVPLNPQGRAIILKGKRSISEGLFRFLHCSPYLPTGSRGGPNRATNFNTYSL